MKCSRCGIYPFECETCCVQLMTEAREKVLCVIDDEGRSTHFCSAKCWRTHVARKKEAMS